MSINTTGPSGGQTTSPIQNNTAPPNPAPLPLVQQAPPPLSQVADPNALNLNSELERMQTQPLSTKVVTSSHDDIPPFEEPGLPVYSPAELSAKQRVFDRASGKLGDLRCIWDNMLLPDVIRKIAVARNGATEPLLIPIPMRELDLLIADLARGGVDDPDEAITNFLCKQAERLSKPLLTLASRANVSFRTASAQDRDKLFALAFDYVAIETPKFFNNRADLTKAMAVTMLHLSIWSQRDPTACEHFLVNYEPSLEYNICDTEFMSRLTNGAYGGDFDAQRAIARVIEQNKPVFFEGVRAAKASKALGLPAKDILLPAPLISYQEMAKHTAKIYLSFLTAPVRIADRRMLVEINIDNAPMQVPINRMADEAQIAQETARQRNAKASNAMDPLFDLKFLDEQKNKYLEKLDICIDFIEKQPLNVPPEKRKAVLLSCAKRIHTGMSDQEVKAVLLKQWRRTRRPPLVLEGVEPKDVSRTDVT
jgi:hypothetical protein